MHQESKSRQENSPVKEATETKLSPKKNGKITTARNRPAGSVDTGQISVTP
jgi:hypothetical protein